MGKGSNVSFKRVATISSSDDILRDSRSDGMLVVACFETPQHGVVQLGRDDDGIETFSAEPSKYHFTEASWEYMVTSMEIIYRLVNRTWDDSLFS